MLSAYSADFSLTTVLGNTALHAAAAEGQTQCCRFLFQRGVLQFILPVIIKINSLLTVINEMKSIKVK